MVKFIEKRFKTLEDAFQFIENNRNNDDNNNYNINNNGNQNGQTYILLWSYQNKSYLIKINNDENRKLADYIMSNIYNGKFIIEGGM